MCLYYIKQVETQSNLPTTKKILKPLAPQQHMKSIYMCWAGEKWGEGKCHVLAG